MMKSMNGTLPECVGSKNEIANSESLDWVYTVVEKGHRAWLL